MKNKSGSNPKAANKVVPVYASPESRPQCLVYLLDTYLSKLPQGAKAPDTFYLRPVGKIPSNPAVPWYECAPVGKEKLRKFLSTMCKEAGIHGKTNHSLRAKGASAMFNTDVPEKLIRDVTGHQSNALNLYERPTLEQRQSVSRVLVQGKQSLTEKENRSKQPTVAGVRHAPNPVGTLFSNMSLSNCTITISPQNMVLNVGSTASGPAPSRDFTISLRECLCRNLSLDCNVFSSVLLHVYTSCKI